MTFTTKSNTVFYRDADGDGYGNALLTKISCTLPAGYVTNNIDCNDSNANINPGANELCGGIDENCNGLLDAADPTLNGVIYYKDLDGDSYGDASATTINCTLPNGYVSNHTDCNDSNASINPGANELCGGTDENCNGLLDAADSTLNGVIYYKDLDGDSYGDASATTINCTLPNGYVTSHNDCNDNNANINPLAFDYCDNIDNDCNGTIDDGEEFFFNKDNDGDGYGDYLVYIGTNSCTPPAGYVDNSDDCNDNDANTYLGANEICDNIDNNCNNIIDDGAFFSFFRDNDGDSYGNYAISQIIAGCTPPAGYVTNHNDCNDNNANINPIAFDYCDNIDNDCNGTIDDGEEFFFNKDNDGDGYGDYLVYIGTNSCTPPAGYVDNSDDCNDNDANSYLGANEICDNIDNNCNNSIDENIINTYYKDYDGDGYGNILFPVTTSACTPPPGYVLNNNDCDDNINCFHPNTVDPIDGMDNDCDGLIDELNINALTASSEITQSLINTIPSEIKWNIYPNPNDGNFIIQINCEKPENSKLKIYTINGILALEISIIENNNTIPINNLPSGLYIAVVFSQSNNLVQKILVH